MRKPSGAILRIGFAALSSDNVKPLSSNESKRKLETYFEEPCKDKMMVIIVFSFVPAGCFCTLCHQIMRNHLKLKSHPKENLIPQSRVAAALLL